MLQKAKKHLSKDPLFIPVLESIEVNTEFGKYRIRVK